MNYLQISQKNDRCERVLNKNIKMEFNFEDAHYLFIEHSEKSVVKLQRDYEWSIEYIDGTEFDLGTLFSNMDIDEIVDSLRKSFDQVEIIDYSDIDDYMEN